MPNYQPAGRGGLTFIAALSLTLVTHLACAANEAGSVLKVVGRASAATQEGQIRTLAQNSPVNAGETVVTTTNSFVRMKLADGAFVVLRPNTRFQIADYKYVENAPDNRSVFSLLRGGFRAITGAIGKLNHSAVSYRTAVATIGIRGTDVEVADCTTGCPESPDAENGVYFKVHDGAIDVNGEQFNNQQAGLVPPNGDPEPIDFNDPNNPLNADPTPSADPQECF